MGRNYIKSFIKSTNISQICFGNLANVLCVQCTPLTVKNEGRGSDGGSQDPILCVSLVSNVSFSGVRVNIFYSLWTGQLSVLEYRRHQFI